MQQEHAAPAHGLPPAGDPQHAGGSSHSPPPAPSSSMPRGQGGSSKDGQQEAHEQHSFRQSRASQATKPDGTTRLPSQRLGVAPRGASAHFGHSQSMAATSLDGTVPMPKGLLARRRQTIAMAQHHHPHHAPAGAGGEHPHTSPRSFRAPRPADTDVDPSHRVVHEEEEEEDGGGAPPGHAAASFAMVQLPRLESCAAGAGAGARSSRSFQARGKRAMLSRRNLLAEDPALPGAAGGTGDSARVQAWKTFFIKALNHKTFYAFLCVTTLYIIFEDDVKRAALPPSFDLPLEIIIACILVCIIVEIGLCSWAKPGYLLGFYFWVDCIVAASLFFEVPAVKSDGLGIGAAALPLTGRDAFVTWLNDRAFTAAKVARVARIFRVLRLLRLYTVFRRYDARRRIRAALTKAGMLQAGGAGNAGGGMDDRRIAEEQLMAVELEMLQSQDKEMRVGQKLQELIIRRIIVVVLISVLVLPIFESTYGLWARWQGVDRGGLAMLHEMAFQWGVCPLAPNATAPSIAALPPSPFTTALLTFMSAVTFRVGSRRTSQLLQLVIHNATYLPLPPDTVRRFDELYFASFDSCDPSGNQTFPISAATSSASGCAVVWHTYGLYDWKWYSQVAALLSIGRSLFVIAFLSLSVWLLNRDSRVLVLEPIERMLARVTALAENPLALQPAAHAPWQEQAERMQRALEQQQADQPQSAHGKAPSRKGSMPDSMLHMVQRKASGVRSQGQLIGAAWPAAGAPPGPTTDGQAIISIGPGATAPPALHWVGSKPEAAPDAWASTSLPASRGASAARLHHPSGLSAGDVSSGEVAPGLLRTWTEAAAAQWRATAAQAQALLKRAVRNFWDGDDEEQAGPRGGANKSASGGDPDGEGKAAAEEAAPTYETQLLENSIQKIGALLAVGFGDAGAEVIAENIRKEGDINPMVPGRRMVGVFGFCDIRKFTDATEVLQEEVMEFVNSIARIVHTSVAIHGGAANKNIGDAFLLVWKFPQPFSMSDLRDACEYNLTTLIPAARTEAEVASALAVAPAQSPEPDWGAGQRAAVGAAASPSPPSWPLLTGPAAVAEGLTAEVESLATQIESMQGDDAQAAQAVAPTTADLALVDAEDGDGGGALLLPSLPTPAALPPSTAHGADGEQQQRSWLQSLSNSTNRVAPLPSAAARTVDAGGALIHVRSRPLGTATRIAVQGLPDAGSKLAPTGSDLESEAVRRVIRLRSKGNPDAGPGASAIAVPDKAALVGAVADNALTSFILVHAALKRSVRLARYSRRADLIARLGASKPMVQMGFGLHVGWAIEGAIGSEYKIDASYLSPNVNMASRLEAATKQFGVSLLMSESFVDCLSPALRARVRQVDCVTVKGSTQPMGLFTYDVALDTLEEPNPDTPGAEEEEEAFWADYACGLCDVDDLGSTWGVTPEFIAVFEQGFKAYKAGRWAQARDTLRAAAEMRCNARGEPVKDGPTQVLLAYMEQHGFEAPASWRGYRELTDK